MNEWEYLDFVKRAQYPLNCRCTWCPRMLTFQNREELTAHSKRERVDFKDRHGRNILILCKDCAETLKKRNHYLRMGPSRPPGYSDGEEVFQGEGDTGSFREDISFEIPGNSEYSDRDYPASSDSNPE